MLPRDKIFQLQQQLTGCSVAAETRSRWASFGCDALDRLLPNGGAPPGSLVEWLMASDGAGAGWLAMRAALNATPPHKVCVLFDRRCELHPLVAAASGQFAPERLVVVRAANEADECWSVEQALRSPAVGAVWIRVPRLDPVHIRRWQLAAESSGALGMLLRPVQARGEPSWANIRLLVEPRPSIAAGRRCRVELLRCRGGGEGKVAELVWDERTGQLRTASHHETHPLPAISELADPASAGRTTDATSPAARSASA